MKTISRLAPWSVSVAGYFVLSVVVHGASYHAGFRDTWSDTGSIDQIDQVDLVTTAGSFTVNIDLPLDGTDLSEADTNSYFELDIGPSGSPATIIADTLGDASRFANKSATFPITGMDALGNIITIGSVTVSWTATSISVTGSTHTDELGMEQMYAGASTGTPGAQLISAVYEITVILDATDNGGGTFNYDNANVPATGSNRETEYNGGGLGPVPLETGSISGAADFTPPKVAITSPRAYSRFSADNGSSVEQPLVVQFKGTASDNESLANIECYLNSDFNNPIDIDQEAALPTNALSWTASINLPRSDDRLGTNLVTVVATDSSGNTNAVSRAFIWVVTNSAMLAVSPVGSGMIKSSITNGQVIQMGNFYPFSAVPASKDWIFADWTVGSADTIISSNQSILLEDAGLPLTANFIPNPFNNTGLAGTYTGLFYDTNDPSDITDAGHITLKVASSGSYTASVFLANINVPAPFSGQLMLPPDGSIASMVGKITLNKVETYNFLVQIPTDTNLAGPVAGVMSGAVNKSSTGAGGPAPTSATVEGWLAMYNPGIVAGHYNAVIGPASDDPSKAPGGYGFASATVGTNASVALVLHLADGVSPAISLSSTVAGNGASPLYASLYGGKGVIMGWLQFATNGSGTLTSSNVNWIKLPVADKYYTSGFAATPALSGALYIAPKPGTNAFGWTAGTFTVDSGYTGLSLPDHSTVGVTFNSVNNKFSDSSKVAATLAPSTGLLSGSFVPTGVRTATAFLGVEAAGAGYGFYVGPNKETGPVLLQAASASPAYDGPFSIGVIDVMISVSTSDAQIPSVPPVTPDTP